MRREQQVGEAERRPELRIHVAVVLRRGSRESSSWRRRSRTGCRTADSASRPRRPRTGSFPSRAAACAADFRNSPRVDCLVGCQPRPLPTRRTGRRSETTRASRGWARQTKAPSRRPRAARAALPATNSDRAGPTIPARNRLAREAQRLRRAQPGPHAPRQPPASAARAATRTSSWTSDGRTSVDLSNESSKLDHEARSSGLPPESNAGARTFKCQGVKGQVFPQ